MQEPKRAFLERRSYTFERVAVAVLACLVLAYVPVYLSLPLGRDQGLFAWVAMVVRDGGLPGRDAWEVKGPLVYLLYALPVSLFGSASWGIRLVDLLFVMGGMALLYAALRPRVATPVALLGALLLFVYYMHSHWFAAQADSWASLLLLACLTLCFTERGRRRLGGALLSGVLLGAMVLIKPLYALYCVLPPVYALASAPREGRANVRFVATAAAGVLLTLSALGLFFWARGGLEALLDIQLRFNPSVYQGAHGRTFVESLRELIAILLRPYILGMHLLAVLGLCVYARRARGEVVLLCVTYALGIITACAQNKFYVYHFFVLYPPLLLAACLGLHATGEVLKAKSRALRLLPRVGAAGVVVLCVQQLSGVMLMYAETTLDYAQGRIGLADYNATFDWGDYYYSDIAYLAQYLSETTGPEDTVLVYGFDAAINFLSNRHSPTRFGFQYPLVASTEPFKSRYRAEFLEALEARPPQVILVADQLRNNLYQATALGLMKDFPRFRAYLERHYTPEVQTPHYRVFRRGSPARADGASPPLAPVTSDGR